MPNTWIQRIKSKLDPNPNLSRKFWIFLVLSIVLWIGLISIRPYVIQTYCEDNPVLCHPSQVNSFDKVAVKKIDYEWGRRSDITQYLSGILAFAGPAALHATYAISKAAVPSIAFASFIKDFLIAFQAVAWTGVATEATKITVQRPRPYVYAAPKHHKHMESYSTYTSFYSGHTSFAAAASFVHFLTLVVRMAPGIWVGGSFLLYLFLMTYTGLARVLSGVHFPSDVIVGGLMGSLISLMIFFGVRRIKKGA